MSRASELGGVALLVLFGLGVGLAAGEVAARLVWSAP